MISKIDDIRKKLFTTKFIKIPVTLKEFKEIAESVIKEETGIDVSNCLYLWIDDETYAIYIRIAEEKLTEEECKKLIPYNINEDCLNTDNVLNALFPNAYSGIYTSQEEIDAANENNDKNNTVCYIELMDVNLPYKLNCKLVKIDNLSNNAKVDLINLFFWLYINTGNDVQDFSSEYYFISNYIIDGYIPVELKYLSDWDNVNPNDVPGNTFIEILKKYKIYGKYCFKYRQKDKIISTIKDYL